MIMAVACPGCEIRLLGTVTVAKWFVGLFNDSVSTAEVI